MTTLLDTAVGIPMEAGVLSNYFDSLVNMFFKILPLKENNDVSLEIYLQNFQAELMGCKNFVLSIQNNSWYLTLLSVLQFLIDNPSCETHKVRREVFYAISICNKLKEKYCKENYGHG